MTAEEYFQNYLVRNKIMIRDESHELCIRAFAPYLYSFCGKRGELPALFSKLGGVQAEHAELEDFNRKRGGEPPYFCDLFIRWGGGAKSYVYYINGGRDFSRLDEVVKLGLAAETLAVYTENSDVGEIIRYFSEYGIKFVGADKLESK